MTSWPSGFFAAPNAVPYPQCCWVTSENLWVLAVGGGGGAAMMLDAPRLRAMVETAVHNTGGPPVTAIPAVLASIHAQVAQLAQEDPWKGTTAQAVVMAREENSVWIGNVGMCRAYMVNRRGVVQLTRDDSLARIQADAGLVGEPWHARIVTRVLGMAEFTPVTVTRHDVRDGDALVMCTEFVALMGEGTEESSARVLRRCLDHSDAQQAARDIWNGLHGQLSPNVEHVFDREVAIAVVRPTT